MLKFLLSPSFLLKINSMVISSDAAPYAQHPGLVVLY
jgi:hypothetical protein